MIGSTHATIMHPGWLVILLMVASSYVKEALETLCPARWAVKRQKPSAIS
jgi:hypothetical protein